MRIVTYNVMGFQGYPTHEALNALGDMNSPERIRHFTHVLSSMKADVLCLQEGASSPALIQAIARDLGMYLATIPSPKNWPGHVLSKYPISESRVFGHLDPTVDPQPLSRAVGVALLEIDANRSLWVLNIHLHPSNRSLRATEADLILRHVEGLLTTVPNMVVLGDFNCAIDEDIHQGLRSRGFANAMETVGGGMKTTFDSSGKSSRLLDHVYVSTPLAPLLQKAEVISTPGFSVDTKVAGTWAHSDHFPVAVDWAFNASSPA